jgi:hypothetical protein
MATMRPVVLASGIALLLAVFAPRPAHACGQGGYGGYAAALAGLAVGAILVGVADLGFTGMDLASLGRGEHRSAAYGLGETLVAAPQFALAIYGLTTNTSKPVFAVYTAWMGLLTAHGIWTIATSSPTTAVPPDAVSPRASPEPVPRLQMPVGPTYVPLGDAAQPGFGVLGRF